tara:strand:+ start:971 stop:1237 length:267 start_codon:yes stop_codon:yes gene_type:complete
MDIEQRLNVHIALAEVAEDLHLQTTLALAKHEIHKRDRALFKRDREISELRGQIWDLKEQIRGARGLLELRKERIEDLLKELGQEETA